MDFKRSNSNSTSTPSPSIQKPTLTPSTPMVPPKKPSGKSKTLTILMTILCLAVAGFAGYLWYEKMQLKDEKKQLSEQISTQSTQINQLESQLDAEKEEIPETSPTTPAASKTDAELASEAARAFYAARLEGTQDLKTFTANQVQESGIFRRFSVGKTGEPGGASVVVKKVGTVWVGIAAGQGLPSKETGESYKLPAGWYSTEY